MTHYQSPLLCHQGKIGRPTWWSFSLLALHMTKNTATTTTSRPKPARPALPHTLVGRESSGPLHSWSLMLPWPLEWCVSLMTTTRGLYKRCIAFFFLVGSASPKHPIRFLSLTTKYNCHSSRQPALLQLNVSTAVTHWKRLWCARMSEANICGFNCFI